MPVHSPAIWYISTLYKSNGANGARNGSVLSGLCGCRLGCWEPWNRRGAVGVPGKFTLKMFTICNILCWGCGCCCCCYFELYFREMNESQSQFATSCDKNFPSSACIISLCGCMMCVVCGWCVVYVGWVTFRIDAGIEGRLLLRWNIMLYGLFNGLCGDGGVVFRNCVLYKRRKMDA